MKEETKSPHPEWALKHKKKGTELRLLSGKYYLYEVTSKWDPVKKRAKKITGKLLGSITKKDGFIDSDKYRLFQEASENKKTNIDFKVLGKLFIKEYGMSFYFEQKLSNYLDVLKSKFSDVYRELICLALIRLCYQSPIKNCGYYYERSFMSELFSDLDMSDKQISSILRHVGQNRVKIAGYMKHFIKADDFVLVDGTHVVSHSKTMDMVKRGYNSQDSYDPQISVVFIFSSSQCSPVFHRIVPGNIRDVTSFKLTLEESGIESAVLIADKGFYSKANTDLLSQAEINYVIPLKRDSSLIDYSGIEKPKKGGFDGFFEFEKRFIWFYEVKTPTEDDTVMQEENNEGKETGKRVILYFDPELKLDEDRSYLARNTKNPEKYTLEEYREKQSSFGTISMCTNLRDKSAQEIYEYYKSRNKIETMFDTMKNVLHADHSYMQNEDALRGWMFINHIALQWYYHFYQLLVTNKLIKRFSVKDIIMHLVGVEKIKINDEWKLAEITKKTHLLLQKLGVPIT